MHSELFSPLWLRVQTSARPNDSDRWVSLWTHTANNQMASKRRTLTVTLCARAGSHARGHTLSKFVSCAVTYTACGYVWTKGLHELWMREYCMMERRSTLKSQHSLCTDWLPMFMHFLLLLHELFSLILVMFSCADYCHNMETITEGVKLCPTLEHFEIQTTNATRLFRICVRNSCWNNMTVVTTLPDILLLKTWLHPLSCELICLSHAQLLHWRPWQTSILSLLQLSVAPLTSHLIASWNPPCCHS